jgi:hypothetical protein
MKRQPLAQEQESSGTNINSRTHEDKDCQEIKWNKDNSKQESRSHSA